MISSELAKELNLRGRKETILVNTLLQLVHIIYNILVLIRFLNRRGHVKEICSDNGTNRAAGKSIIGGADIHIIIIIHFHRL
jgi:hypothetical protein